MTFAQNASSNYLLKTQGFVKNTTDQRLTNTQFEPGRVHEILSDLGYQLQDFGQYYRTRALYRGGDSVNSLKIWKNSGYCIDYAADKKFSLRELLSHHIQDWRKIKEILGGQRISAPIKIEKKIIMPRIYPPDCLDRSGGSAPLPDPLRSALAR